MSALTAYYRQLNTEAAIDSEPETISNEALIDGYVQIDQSLEAYPSDHAEVSEDYEAVERINHALESFHALEDALKSDACSADTQALGRSLIQSFYKEHALGDAPSMESLEELTVATEGVIASLGNALKNVSNRVRRVRLSFLNDRDSAKTAKALRAMAKQLEARLKKVSFDSVEIDLSLFGDAFVMGTNTYTTNLTASLASDSKLVHAGLLEYSKRYFGYIQLLVRIENSVIQTPNDGEKFLDAFLNTESVSYWFDQTQGKNNASKLLNKSVLRSYWWDVDPNEFKNLNTAYAFDQPISTVERNNNQPATGNPSVTIKHEQVKALIDYINAFAKLVEEASSLWARLGDHILQIAAKSKKMDVAASQADRDADAWAIKALHAILFRSFQSLEGTQKGFFKHGLRVSKACSRLLEKVIAKAS